MKVRIFLEASTRELELLKAIYLNGFAPKVQVSDKVFDTQVTITDIGNSVQANIKIEVDFPDKRKNRSVILLDKDYKPLYRKTLNNLDIHLGPTDVYSFTWNISIMSSE